MALVGFSGAVHALSTTTTLSKNVIADLNDRATRYDSRTTCTYDAPGNRFFAGATESGAGEYAISMMATTDGSDIIKTALTPATIFTINGGTDTVANPAYNARVWEMDYFISGTNKYIAAIMQLEGETGNGGSRLVVINTAIPQETYVSAAAMSCESSTGTASRFVKLAAAHKGSDATARIVIAAVADSTTNEFSTAATSNAGLRAFEIPASPTDNALTQIDINGGTAGSGKLMANTAALMSLGLRRLTSMIWDSTVKVLYLGGHMSDSTFGIFGFTLDGTTNAVTTLNHTTGGTLLGSASNLAIPALSRIHKLAIMRAVGSGATCNYLVIQSGESSKQKNNIYCLRLRSNGQLYATGSGGVTAAGGIALGLQDLDLKANANGTLLNAALCVVGQANFPLQPGSFITDVKVVGSGVAYRVYVTTSNAALGTDVWAAVPTLAADTAVLSAWTVWRRVVDSSLQNANTIGSNATYIWAVKDRNVVYVNSAIGSLAASVQPSLGLANVKAASARARLRKLAAFDAVNRQLIMSAAGTPDGYSMSSVHNYTVATGVNAAATESADEALTLGAGVAVWDTATITQGGVTDRFYLLQDDVTTPKPGGTTIVKVAGLDGAVTTIKTGTGAGTAFFKDGNGTPAASKCFKIVAGTNLAGTPVLFCFIADATNKDNFLGFNADTTTLAADGEDDIIKVLLASDLSVVAASVKYQDVVDPQDDTIVAAQCAYFDDVLKVLYIGAQLESGEDQPGLAFLKLSGTTITSGLVIPDGAGSESTVKDIWQLSSLHTPAGSGTSRNILLMAATLLEDAGDVNTGGVYALPIFSTTGDDLGKAAVTAYTTVATDSDSTWNATTRPDLFTVGGTAPWNPKSAIVDIQVVGLNVFVTVANAPGLTGLTGVFVTSAICSTAGALLGWTPWKLAGGLNTSIQNIAFDAVSGKLIGLDLASGMPTVASWKAPEDVSAFDQLAKAFNTDFANNGGVYSLSSHTARTGVTYADDALSAASMNMVVATGNKAVAIAHVGYKADSATASTYNPDSTNIYGYKSFMNDSALISLGGVYCSAMSRGSAGWIFVGGENGVAVLRVSGATGDAGKGWTGGVPTSLQHTTSSSTTLADMTWFKIPGITGPIHKMITVYNYSGTSVDGDNHVEALIAMGPNGVYAFTLAAGKFTDADATALQLSSLTEFTSGVSERVWDIAPLYRGAGMFAVGTTRGLYVAKLTGDTPTLSVVAEIEDADSASLGAVASISVIDPIITSAQNPVYRIDCVTANARTDVSKHYTSDVTFVQLGDMGAGKGLVSGTPSATLVKTLDRMTTQILNAAGVYSYSAAVPNRKSALLQVLSSSIQSSTDPVLDGLVIPTGSTLGQLTTVDADGSRLITVGGRVYVKST